MDYTMMLDSAKTLGVFRRDSNASLVSTSELPINSWTNGKLSDFRLRHIQCHRRTLALTSTVTDMAINNIHPSSSIAYTEFIHAQMANHTTRYFNVSFDAANTTFSSEVGATSKDPSGEKEKGIPGTYFATTFMPNAAGREEHWVLFQTVGNDITHFKQFVVGDGNWTREMISIPSE